MRRGLGRFAAIWGAVGLCALLVYAIARLSVVIAAGWEEAWQPRHVVVAVVNAVFMAWSEGYRGFQQRFSPRSAARVKWLRHHATPLRALLAPLFVMGYFDAPRRRLLGAYGLTLGIVVAIVAIHALSQPWRAALDIGVVLGLSWGLATFLAALRSAFAAPGYPVSPETASCATDESALSR